MPSSALKTTKINIPPCFAIHADLPNKRAAIGTGFLATDASQKFWIVTCAHLPTQAQPTIDFWLWPDNVTIHTPKNSAVIPIFETTNGERSPLFRWRNQPGPYIEDIMAIPLGGASLPKGMMKESRPIIRLVKPSHRPNCGEAMVAHGFPDAEQYWPYWPPKTASGIITQSPKTRIMQSTAPSLVGFSGGPVFGENGSFVGMTIGGDPHEFIPQPEIVDFFNAMS